MWLPLVFNDIIRQTEAGGLRVTGQLGLLSKIISQKRKEMGSKEGGGARVAGRKMDGREWRNPGC